MRGGRDRTGWHLWCNTAIKRNGFAAPANPAQCVPSWGGEWGLSWDGGRSGCPEIQSLAGRGPGQGNCGDGHRRDGAYSSGAWPVASRDAKAPDHGGRHDLSGRDWRKLHGKSQVPDLWAFQLGPLLLRSQYRCGVEGPGSPEASLGPGLPGQRSTATGPAPQLARTSFAVLGLRGRPSQVLLCRSWRSFGTRPL